MSITVSWLMLTYNRADKVEKSIRHNLTNAGDIADEVCWVDNGSTDNVRSVVRRLLNPDVSVLHNENLGVAKGYNRAMLLASKEYILITGCDMLMPKDWLKTFKEYVANIPDTGVACIYSQPIEKVPERRRGEIEFVNGLPVMRAMPIGRRIYKRELLKKIGYLREDFGLYGHEDVEWGYRAERVCDEQLLRYYMIPGQIAEHLGNEGVEAFNGMDEKSYHEFKQCEVNDPHKEKLMTWCRQRKWPYYNPYI